MQKHRGGTVGDARVAIGGPGRVALEQGQYPAHAVDCIKGRHRVNLRGARIGETDLHTAIDQRD